MEDHFRLYGIRGSDPDEFYGLYFTHSAIWRNNQRFESFLPAPGSDHRAVFYEGICLCPVLSWSGAVVFLHPQKEREERPDALRFDFSSCLFGYPAPVPEFSDPDTDFIRNDDLWTSHSGLYPSGAGRCDRDFHHLYGCVGPLRKSADRGSFTGRRTGLVLAGGGRFCCRSDYGPSFRNRRRLGNGRVRPVYLSAAAGAERSGRIYPPDLQETAGNFRDPHWNGTDAGGSVPAGSYDDPVQQWTGDACRNPGGSTEPSVRLACRAFC